MTINEIMQIISGFLGSLGFAIIFNIRGSRLFTASLGGLLSWTLFILLGRFIPNETVCYFLVALLSSTYAEIIARLQKTPTTAIITVSLVPLIPGSSLYYTTAYAVGDNTEAFISQAVHTLELAVALAVGVIAATTAAKILTPRKKS